MFKKNNTIEWDEIYISSKQNTSTLAAIASLPQDTAYEKKSLREKSDILEMKKYWKENSQMKLSFNGEIFLQTNLLGDIFFNKEFDFQSLDWNSTFPIDRDIRLRLEKVHTFFDKNFIDDIEILDILAFYLISEKRIADLVSISNKFLYKNLLPLKYQFFFILSNIYENSLNNIILSGDETLIINILYKYKYLSLGKKEQDFLYDSVISGKYPNLIGVVFQLYKNTFKGIRNIFPILNLIQTRWKLLSKEEKREFISVYQNTNQYLKTFFLMRKTFSNLEIKTWIKKINLLNGKDSSYNKSIEEKLASVDEKMKLHSKFTLLKEAKFLVNLAPFELILLFNSSVSMELREEIGEFYEKYPYSYSANRSLAVIFFQDGDYQKFLLQISKAGNFLFHVEVLYLKAIAYREIGIDEESKKIFNSLKIKYPNSEILLKEAGLT